MGSGRLLRSRRPRGDPRTRRRDLARRWSISVSLRAPSPRQRTGATSSPTAEPGRSTPGFRSPLPGDRSRSSTRWTAASASCPVRRVGGRPARGEARGLEPGESRILVVSARRCKTAPRLPATTDAGAPTAIAGTWSLRFVAGGPRDAAAERQVDSLRSMDESRAARARRTVLGHGELHDLLLRAGRRRRRPGDSISARCATARACASTAATSER